MKFKSIIFVISFIFFFWFFIPKYTILLNLFYALPVFSDIVYKIIGYIIIGVSLGIILHMTFMFKKYGKGTPSITETTKKLVRQGIFKYTRNPMYISNSLVIVGIFFLNGHLLLLAYALLFFVSMHLFLVYVEEPELKKKYGKSYERFLEEVPRWF